MRKLLPGTPKKGKLALFFFILISLFLSLETWAHEQPRVNIGFRNASMEQVIKKVEQLFKVQNSWRKSPAFSLYRLAILLALKGHCS
jgi:hypothetical protein